MNAERLLQHYERIANTPDAIARLRRFILDLAVRGKLVPQDPKDEPASELLRKIEKEKARLIKAGEIKKSEVDPVHSNDAPFIVPSRWTWTRLGSIGDWGSGSTPPRGNSELYGGNIPWLKSGELNDNRALVGSEETVTERALEKCSFRRNKPGDILIAMYGATIGKVAILAESAVTNQAVCGCTPFAGVLNQFLFLFLLSQREQFHSASEGGAQPNISKVKIIWTPFSLPPLAEQHRIVAKVDELMALCDRLEAARADREATRDRLAAASLARLNAPDPDPALFAGHARFALDNLSALAARPDQIKQIRQTILNLAVQGKLVGQDAKDEPASALLKRIDAENKMLLSVKGLRPQKPALPAEKFEIEMKIPASWRHVYLQELAYQITDGTHLTPKYVDHGKPFLSAQNVKPFKFLPDKHRFVSEADFENYRANRRPERGDILMTRVGAGIGEAAILDSDFEFAFYVSLCLIKIPQRFLCPEYLALWLNSPEGRESSTARTYGKGASQGNLNLGLIRTFKIPLPPVAEQQRIVKKVDALMAQCDQLEASLTAAETIRRRLLEALLAEALAPVGSRELEVAE
ncbi:MAG: restriction endonuclease subunit S [Alphaproteobacteria bacterium]|nr:restriction endonuclease subunit S [Alphaproteobacteria bacterium]